MYAVGLKQVKVKINELAVGMFVSDLDRPWSQTPFPIQGFYIRNLDDIKSLGVHCRYVYIDSLKGSVPSPELRKMPSPDRARGSSSHADRTVKPNVAPLKIKRTVHSTATPLTTEIFKARELHLRVFEAVGEVMKMVESDHHNLSVQETKRAASAMVDSVVRNPDAFAWLSRVREKDEHTYSHAVRSAVWALLFGRNIGLPKADLDVLAMGVLLKDIGKTRLPQELLEKTHRSNAEREAYEQFVDYSVAILRQVPNINPRVISVVKTHCERVNGSGFPQHLRGDKIPLLGKIAGIVTYYDETTNPRMQNSKSPSRAVAKLYDVRDLEFQEELVVEFIRAIGLYPTGTLVELSSGEVAVVVEQNFHRRLKPKVMVVMDSHKEPVKPSLIDLAVRDKQRQDLLEAGKPVPSQLERLEIAQDLEPGSYGLDVAGVLDAYLSTNGGGLIAAIKRKTLMSRLFG